MGRRTKIGLCAVFLLVGLFMSLVSFTEEEESPPAQEIEESHSETNDYVDSLTNAEKRIYDALSPLYQKIFLYALDDEQRLRVVVYTNRGLSPFESVDVILRSNKRQNDQSNGKKPNSPAKRAVIGAPKEAVIL